jgi:hypothetical protein
MNPCSGVISGIICHENTKPRRRASLPASHNVTWHVLYELNEESKLGMDREIEAAKDEFVHAWKASR